MQLPDIIALHRRPAYPSVSLLATVPEETPKRVVSTLRAQCSDAAARLAQEFASADIKPVIDELERTIAAVDPGPHVRSVAVYVSAHESTWVALPVSVRERVVVDETFATRDVVHALLRARRYRVLTLGARSQLFEGNGRILAPVRDGFPIEMDETPASDAPRRRERTDRDRHRLRVATRAVDDALDRHVGIEPLPLFVIGIQPRLGWFERHSRHRRSISAVATGASHSLAGIQRAVEPLVDELLAETTRDAEAQIDIARSARRLATGIAETWQLAREGRGSLVVVEETFEYPALVGADPFDLQLAPDASAPGVIDDLVDETIETVLAQGGRAAIVPDGTLTAHDRICLTLRY